MRLSTGFGVARPTACPPGHGQQVLADLLDLVLPRDCAGCARPGRTLCPGCATALTRAGPLSVRPPDGVPRLVAAGTYAGVLRAVLLAHKERGRLGLAGPLGRALATAVRAHGDTPVVLVPVPSSRAAVRARGHDHARRVAGQAAGLLGLRSAALLRPVRVVLDQSGLSARQRAVNLHGALEARRRLDGVPVLLVDDVVTTGATLAEAGRALAAAGADVRGAAVVAATPLRAPPGRGQTLSSRADDG